MDWLIHHLVGDVVTHYWYNSQLKEYRFLRNSKEEFIVVSAIVRAREIPNDYVWLYPKSEDIAHVGSVNHEGKVWTVYSPDTEWVQCTFGIGRQGMTCKHTMKVF
jgi:flavin-dependent dehydrogenase